MPIVETEVIVLQIRDYRETSLLATLLGRTTGRISCLAKGARRRTSNIASALQPFSFVCIKASAPGGDKLATIISADLVTRPAYARPMGSPDAFQRMAYAGLFAEVLALGHPDDPYSESLYALAEDFFQGLDRADYPGSFAVSGYFALIAALGYAPDLSEIRRSPAGNSPTGEAREYHFDLVEGTVHPSHAGRTHEDFILTRDELVALQRIHRNQVESEEALEPLVITRRVGLTLARLAIRLFETHLERRLRSARFLEEMVLKPMLRQGR